MYGGRRARLFPSKPLFKDLIFKLPLKFVIPQRTRAVKQAGTVYGSVIPALGREGQKDEKFKALFGYIVIQGKPGLHEALSQKQIKLRSHLTENI